MRATCGGASSLMSGYRMAASTSQNREDIKQVESKAGGTESMDFPKATFPKSQEKVTTNRAN